MQLLVDVSIDPAGNVWVSDNWQDPASSSSNVPEASQPAAAAGDVAGTRLPSRRFRGISCITSCGKCEYCRRGMYSHCTTGGWILGNEIDGTQTEYVRIPHADTSLYPIPQGAEARSQASDHAPVQARPDPRRL